MCVVASGAADRLRSIVDEDVDVVELAVHEVCKRLHSRDVAQIQANHLQSMNPGIRIRLSAVAQHGVVGKPSGGDNSRASAQELQYDVKACKTHAPQPFVVHTPNRTLNSATHRFSCGRR